MVHTGRWMASWSGGRYGCKVTKPPRPAPPDLSTGKLASVAAHLELVQAGRFNEAIAAAESAVKQRPSDPAAWSALAFSLYSARRPELALSAWDKAVELAPNSADLLCGKGRTLQTLGRTEDAKALYRRALSKDPGGFEPAFNLALLDIEAGDWKGADRWALGLASRYSTAVSLRWLRARIALGRREFSVARIRLEALLSDVQLGPEQRADGLIMLGEALDALGRFQEAFRAVVEGKSIQRRLFAERARGRESAVARFERLTRWFGVADPDPWRLAPAVTRLDDAPVQHVFLVGFPRSGTTLLEQALAGHRDVVALEEAPTLAAAHAEFIGSPNDLHRLANLSDDEAAHWRARYWAEVRGLGVDPAGRVFLDKAPAGTVDLPLVAKLFPQAKVLFAIRDPRDVVLSCLRQAFQLNAMTYAFTDFVETAACYSACMELAQVYQRCLPLQQLEVRHEDLIADFEPGLALICDFLGLAFDPAMADIAKTAARRSVRTPSASQVRAGLNRKGISRWKFYERELAGVLPQLATWVNHFGYDGPRAGAPQRT